MFDDLYDNIGGKIKISAKCLFVIGTIASVIAGIVLMISELLLYGIFVAVFGPVSALISSWILYAFGELTESAVDNEYNTRNILKQLKESSATNGSKVADSADKFIGKTNPEIHKKETEAIHRWRCDGCGNMRSQNPCEYCGKE